MNPQPRQFQRCNVCKTKPATIRRWVNEQDIIKLCYNCDQQTPEQSDQRKEIIPYDEMLDLSHQQLQQQQLQQQQLYGLQQHPVYTHSHQNSQISGLSQERQKQSAKKPYAEVSGTSYRDQTQSSSSKVAFMESNFFKEELTPNQSKYEITPKQSKYEITPNQSKHQITPNQSKHQSPSKYTPPKQTYMPQKQDIFQRISQPTKYQNDINDINPEAKALELKYRIRLQEQENTIQLLKSHLENIEQRHHENLTRTRVEVNQTEESAYRDAEKHVQEMQRIKSEYESRIQTYMGQVQGERNRSDQMEIRLENLRKTHETKTIDLQQQITRLRAEIERQKLEKEKVLAECDELVSTQRRQAYEENERILNDVKKEFSLNVAESRERLSVKTDELLECRNQIQHLQQTLKEVEGVWQRKCKLLQLELDESKQLNLQQDDIIQKIEMEKKNIYQEYKIQQKELELQQEEKHRQHQQIKQATEKQEKLEKFIYGAKKSKKLSDKKQQI